MDRCELFAQLTKSNDESCTLFEEILDEFFDEYSFLYGAIKHNGFIDNVNMRCLDNQKSKLEIEVILTKDIVSDFFVTKVGSFLNEKFAGICDLSVSAECTDTVLIIFKKG